MIRYLRVLIALVFISHSSNASELKAEFNLKNFENAINNANQLKFVVESTKVGLFSSDVPGYVKEFTAKAELNDKTVSKMQLILKSHSFDTDSESRDKKLKDHCLSMKKFPEIKIKILQNYELGSGEKSLPAIVEIRGKEKKTDVKIEIESNGDFLIVSAESEWSLKKMEIPDPSIAIAKLSDEIEINTKLQLPLK